MALHVVSVLNCFCDYLQENSQHSLQEFTHKYPNLTIDYKEFLTTGINSNVEIKNAAERVLSSLGVSRLYWGRFLNTPIKVYDFLVELSELIEDHPQNAAIQELLYRVDEGDIGKKIKIGTGVVLAVLGFSALSPFLLSGFTAIQQLLIMGVFFPSAGILYTLASGSYLFFQSLFNPKLSARDFFQDNFFLFVSSVVNIAAYGIVIGTAATLSPVTSFLFILSSLIRVLKEIVSAVQFLREWKKNNDISEMDPLASQQQGIRLAYEYTKHRNKIIINLVTAIAATGVVATWCFIPAGILPGLLGLMALGLVYLASSVAQTLQENLMRDKLEQQFTTLESQFPEPNLEHELKDEAVDLPHLQEFKPTIPGIIHANKANKIGFFFKKSAEIISSSNSPSDTFLDSPSYTS
ncbi:MULTISPECIES: hypothetical protein [Legionella]|uniref:Uncharacterized protein n=1 Tax=Legionella septentrionalis TaxID=2498109 RepID=A0A3S0XS52_9GAMM|nr:MULTISPECIES: hypothetical protein [Legionella]MCP0913005.1 hypothetical protein [Legionella sp. 27cVA30]RUQ81666.1 hypothetical protein EKM59_09780 [Legionella septentrionalis]RUQ96851.1 hypothetical protein ELY11_07015 [Legionella septentrionalis]RUR10916.1 hypothetical protein ELY14_03690 [Legionella septentrionalis]RUR15356.1 hypothetical protein ELY10_06020 [Legionella septentrionalis]